MKILQINSVNKFASTGRTMFELNVVLEQEGYETFCAFSEGIGSEKDYCFNNSFDKKLHSLLSRTVGIQGYFSKKETKKLLQYIKNNQIDIVRIGNLHSNFINIPILLNYLAENDIATVLTLDDCFFYTAKCTHYTLDNCNKWRTGCHNCIRNKKDNPSWFFDQTNKMWNDKKNLYEKIPRLAVVGVSDWITNEARQSILSSALKLETIYNWIDTEEFQPLKTSKKEFNLEGKYIILGVATQWTSQKGLDTFIEISEHLDPDELIILVGNMDRKQSLSNNILHIEQTDNIQELVKYYNIADVFFQLSKEETFGKVVAEALSCGTPVLTIDSTANAELVNDFTGIVCPVDITSNDIIKEMRKIKEKGKLKYTQQCRKFAQENFEKDKKIKQYLEIFACLQNEGETE